jgi:hypothetical protein
MYVNEDNESKRLTIMSWPVIVLLLRISNSARMVGTFGDGTPSCHRRQTNSNAVEAVAGDYLCELRRARDGKGALQEPRKVKFRYSRTSSATAWWQLYRLKGLFSTTTGPKIIGSRRNSRSRKMSETAKRTRSKTRMVMINFIVV